MSVVLLKHQTQAIEKMSGIDGFGLFDEMGVGKTFSALGEIHSASENISAVLVVAPKSTHYGEDGWEGSIRRMFEGQDIPITFLDGPNKDRIEEFKWGFCIVNSEALRLIPELASVMWDYIILDEAHVIKNRKAQRTKALKKLKAYHKRALTGTPIVNRPDELWSILNWLYPKQYRSYWRFFEAYVQYWQHPQYGYKTVLGPKNVEQLRAEIGPFILRRTKEEVMPDLPDKYYTHVMVDLGARQRKAYDEMKKESLAWVGKMMDQPLPAPTVLAQLTRLRQFATAYCQIEAEQQLVDIEDDSPHIAYAVRMSEPSSKLDAMMELIEGTERPVVVFSQFRQLIDLAVVRLKDAGISVSILTGKTPQAARGQEIERFQTGDSRVFLATMQAGGVGITLHASSTAIFLDRSWSPAMNAQAEDRLHRYGQKNAVQIILIQARKTVDQVVESKLERKASWFRQILG